MPDIDYSKYGATSAPYEEKQEAPQEVQSESSSGIDYSKYGATSAPYEDESTGIKTFLSPLIGDLPKLPSKYFAPTKEAINQISMMATPGGIISPLLKSSENLPLIGNALRNASQAISNNPLLNKFMSMLGSGTEGATVGALTNPQDRLKGAELGFGLGTGGHLAGKAVNTINTSYQNPVQHDLPAPPVLPNQPELPQLSLPKPNAQNFSLEVHQPAAPLAANDLLEKLGQGSTNKEEAATKLASMIRNSHDQRLAESGTFFQHPLQIAGNEKLYEKPNPLISTNMDKEIDMLSKLKGLKVGQLYDAFKNNPSISNAHELQSELGSAIDDLKSNTAKTADDRATIKNIGSVRNQLQNDIGKAFERHDKNSNDNLAPMYQRGVTFYRENVAPYLSSPEMREITRNRVETPKNIESIFNTPTNFDKNGQSKIGPINKIMSDLPPEAKDLILYNKIGASKNIGNHEKLLNDLNSAKNEGYSSYFNPHVNDAMKDIAEKEKNDIANKENIDLRNKALLKQKDREYKNANIEAKAEHKRQTDQLKSAHNIAKTNALLQHKYETAQIKEQNAMNAEKIKKAKSQRNFLLGSSIGIPLMIGGYDSMKDKINSLLRVLE